MPSAAVAKTVPFSLLHPELHPPPLIAQFATLPWDGPEATLAKEKLVWP